MSKMAIANAVKNFFDTDNWKYTFNENNCSFQYNLTLKVFHIHGLITTKENSYTHYMVLPIHANPRDPETLAQISEYVNRANYGLIFGCFELDPNDGELRYRFSVDCNDNLPGNELIRRSILIPANMIDRYGKGFMNILINGASAKDAIDEAEGNKPSAPTPQPETVDAGTQELADADSGDLDDLLDGLISGQGDE